MENPPDPPPQNVPVPPNKCRFVFDGAQYILSECNCLPGSHQPATPPVPEGKIPAILEIECVQD